MDAGADAGGGRAFLDNLRWRLHGLDRDLSQLAHPVSTARQLRADWPAWREAFAEQRAPRTSLNRPVGAHRRLALVRSRLEAAKQIAHAHGAKVNDVVLTAVAGGLRELLRSRGEDVEDLVLRRWCRYRCTGSSPARRGATSTE